MYNKVTDINILFGEVNVHRNSEHRIVTATISIKNFEKKVQEHRIVCYNLCVAHRYPQQGGGVNSGVPYFFFYRCYGWCSLPLHHQMVRR